MISLRTLVVVALLSLLFAGCSGMTASIPPFAGDPLRISEVAGRGDPTRRASTGLVLAGLAAEESGRAVSDFERAIALDATNPYAYLALAAQEIQWGDVGRGVQSLRQAELLLESEQLDSPRVAPHLDGLHGRARLREPWRFDSGDPSGAVTSGESLLKSARRRAPNVWGDGWLEPAELR